MRRGITALILAAFLTNTFVPYAHASAAFGGETSPARMAGGQLMDLPDAGMRLDLSQAFAAPLLKGIKVYGNDPFRLDFILDRGDGTPAKDDANRLIKYFLAALTVPEEDLWVNLSPYEKDRIVPEAFGRTEMGRDLLAQDYILKQITASLMYPEGDVGREFWAKIYAQAQEKFGTTDIPVDTFNKVWIVPEKATVYENKDAAFVVESRLKVMLESDYLAASKSDAPEVLLAKEVLRSVVIPVLEKEVNEGRNFASLRQVYYSLIVATWFKDKIKQTILGQAYVDRKKIRGVDIQDKAEKEKIWAKYVEAFKKGVFNFVKEEPDAATGEMVPRKYFSGGAGLQIKAKDVYRTTDEASRLPKDFLMDKAEIIEFKGEPMDMAQADASQSFEEEQIARAAELFFDQKEASRASGLLDRLRGALKTLLGETIARHLWSLIDGAKVTVSSNAPVFARTLVDGKFSDSPLIVLNALPVREMSDVQLLYLLGHELGHLVFDDVHMKAQALLRSTGDLDRNRFLLAEIERRSDLLGLATAVAVFGAVSVDGIAQVPALRQKYQEDVARLEKKYDLGILLFDPHMNNEERSGWLGEMIGQYAKMFPYGPDPKGVADIVTGFPDNAMRSFTDEEKQKIKGAFAYLQNVAQAVQEEVDRPELKDLFMRFGQWVEENGSKTDAELSRDPEKLDVILRAGEDIILHFKHISDIVLKFRDGEHGLVTFNKSGEMVADVRHSGEDLLYDLQDKIKKFDHILGMSLDWIRMLREGLPSDEPQIAFRVLMIRDHIEEAFQQGYRTMLRDILHPEGMEEGYLKMKEDFSRESKGLPERIYTRFLLPALPVIAPVDNAALNVPEGVAVIRGGIYVLQDEQLIQDLWRDLDPKDARKIEDWIAVLQKSFEISRDDPEDLQVIRVGDIGELEDFVRAKISETAANLRQMKQRGFIRSMRYETRAMHALYRGWLTLSLGLENIKQHGDGYGAFIFRSIRQKDGTLRIVFTVLDRGKGFLKKDMQTHAPIEEAVKPDVSFGVGGWGGQGLAKLFERSDKLEIKTINRGPRGATPQAYYFEKGMLAETRLPRAPLEQGTLVTFLKDTSLSTVSDGIQKTSERGGIDLDPKNMSLNVQSAGSGAQFNFDPAAVRRFQDASGLTPVIMNISPMTMSLPTFLGLSDNSRTPEMALY
jgi:hypothetical protein